MRKWHKEALESVMDASACTQDAIDNVVPLFEGISIRREIDQAEDALRLKIRALTRELYHEREPARRSAVYAEIKRLWILETANEAREDLQDCRETKWIASIKRAIEKVLHCVQKAASALETLLTALRKTRVKQVI